jgi:hypothetical protein
MILSTKESGMAEDENVKRGLEEGKELRERIMKDFAERMKGKPTPTQLENDLHALGANFHEHEADGSAPDPHVHVTKQVEANKPAGGYQTRQTQAAPAPAPASPGRAPVHPHQPS